MSIRRILVVCGFCLTAPLWAEPPQEAARKVQEASVARQAQSVAAMQISIEKQRAAAGATAGAAAGSWSGSATPPFFVLSWPALGSACEAVPDADLSPLIEEASRKEGVDANLLRAVAAQESGLHPCAVSSKGAMGLMQLMPATARELGVRDPFDPAESLVSGARLLKQLLARFNGDTALALGAYNAGPSRVEESGGIPEIPETIHYVQQIMNRLPVP